MCENALLELSPAYLDHDRYINAISIVNVTEGGVHFVTEFLPAIWPMVNCHIVYLVLGMEY